MFQSHILKQEAFVALCPCTAVVSGIEKCGKTAALTYFLHHAIQPKHNIPVAPFLEESYSIEDRECLSCYRVIILGVKPFKKLTWLMPTTNADGAVMCLLSYFANLCNVRSQGNPDYHTLLEFAPLPASTSKGIDSFDPEVRDQITLLYSKLMEGWQRLKKDKQMQAVMPTGVCLLNIFDVGPSKAAQAFCPFLNQYCQRSMNIACYEGSRDSEELKKEFAEKSDHQYYQSKTYQLLKPLSGCKHKSQIVNLAEVSENSFNQRPHLLHELKEAVQNEIQIENIHPLSVSVDSMESAKIQLEQSVINGSFYVPVTLRSMLLLHRMRMKCKSFWMKRSEIETLSKDYMFSNGDLEAFLRLFSSFGHIFYTHDIRSLNEYVVVNVVQFVKQIHTLYHSKKEGAERYGLFKQRDEEDWKVIFEFLTVLGIAAEVKSNQIVPLNDLSLDTATFYYYIPSARSYSTPDTSNTAELSQNIQNGEHSIEFTSLKGYSKENLQAVLCEYLLLSADCLLIPTETINTTAIRFCSAESGAEDEDIQFMDVGNKVMILSLNDPAKTRKRKEKIYSRISPFFETNTRQNLQRQQLVEALGNVKLKKGYIPPHKMITFAKQLVEQKHDLRILAAKFELKEEWLHHRKGDLNFADCEVIQCMLYEFKEKVTFSKFKSVLKDLNVEF